MSRKKTYSIIALICSIWFVLFGSMWVYLANVVLVFPVAIVGFVLWRKSKPETKNLRYTITGALFLIGSIISVVALLLYR
jgi:hypothetical protein